MAENRTYIAIDLKSFYASVECVERRLNPLKTNLVVADAERTEKTICLAVSPSLKRYGIPGRARLFEVVQRVKEINAERAKKAPGGSFSGTSVNADELDSDPALSVDYITASPRMSFYMDYSSRIYDIYLKYIAPEDIHVYSVDEVFMDVTGYLNTYRLTAHELAVKMIREVLSETGITATAGIGTNLYLCKIAMDIVAKRIPADKDGVRIAELDEQGYRRMLWEHTPITDFWRVGAGTARKLAKYGMTTMGDIARCSLGGKNDYYNEDLLYRLFGVNAELLIDHAWGYEPVRIKDIKAYRPENNSLGHGQVLKEPYDHEKGAVIVAEMADILSLSLVEKRLVTNQIVLNIGFDTENLKDSAKQTDYKGEVTYDRYGRPVPKPAHGSENLAGYTSSTRQIMKAASAIFERISDPALTIRRVSVVANNVIPEKVAEKRKNEECFEQLELFPDPSHDEASRKKAEEEDRRERNMQEALIEIHNRFGKNAVLKGLNFREGATTIERNGQIGGHKA
ncbi:MAG: DNA methylase [Lachnospiraceae bacterium]|nr:DNA methylase [Lachnospiraceae bacterium]